MIQQSKRTPSPRVWIAIAFGLIVALLPVGLMRQNGMLRIGRPQPTFKLPLVTYEFRYCLPKAVQVDMLWGINGWKTVPEDMRPARTVIKDGMMQTPMTHQQDVFTVEIHVLANSEINYGFLITTDGEGDSTQTIWDGDHYSTIIATLSRTLEIDSPVVLPEASPAKE